MKSILLLILLFYGLIANKVNAKEMISYGFYANSTIFSNEKEVKIAIELWIKEFLDIENIELNILIYKDVDKMIDDFVNKKSIDIVGFNSITFLTYKNLLMGSYKNMFTFTGSQERYIQYYLIDSKKDNKKNEFNLTSKDISIKKGDLSAKIWLDFLSMKKHQQGYVRQINKELVLEKQSSGILKVYFNEVDYAVVTKRTWEIMSELNPSITDKIKVVKKSPVIFTSYIGMLSKRLSQNITIKFITSARKVNTTARGKQILSLLKVHRIICIEDSYLDKLEYFLAEHKELRKGIK